MNTTYNSSGISKKSSIQTAPTTVYRVWGGNARAAGQFMTFEDLNGLNRSQIRDLLAIDESFNDALYIAKIEIPAGKKLNVGFSNKFGPYQGGGNQVQSLEWEDFTILEDKFITISN